MTLGHSHPPEGESPDGPDGTVVSGLFRTPGGRMAQMRYRLQTNCLNTLVSCMNEDEYSLRGICDTTVDCGGTMVDVGGYLGGVGIGWAIDHPASRVWIVEPLSANVDLIRENVALNELEARVTIVAAAVGKPGQKHAVIRWSFGDDESGRHHRFVGNSMLNTPAQSFLSEKVPAIDLPGLVKLAGGHIDLMKVDVESAEYDLFAKGAAGVGEIRGEYHDGAARLAGLIDETHNFYPTGTDHFGGFRAVAM